MQEYQGVSAFDRLLGKIDGLPGVQRTRPTTVLSIMPFLGNALTYVVQTYRTADDGFIVFLQMVDAEGRERLVLPDKVAQAIYRQRQSLTDRSTPASRERQRHKREREKRRREREARRQRWQSETGA